MKSLYSKFILLGITFLLVTLCLQWLPWRDSFDRSSGMIPLNQRTDQRKADDNVIREVKLKFDQVLAQKKRGGGASGKIKWPVEKDNHDRTQRKQAALREDGAKDIRQKLHVGSEESENRKNSGTRFHDMQMTKSGELDTETDKQKLRDQSVKREKISRAARLPFIYDTTSGQDRIPEQMAFVPSSLVRPGIVGVRHKVIAVFSSPESWGVKSGVKTFVEHKCPVRTCRLVSTSSLPNQDRVDAILFSQDIPSDLSEFSKFRTPDTVFVFFALESPMVTSEYGSIKNVLNWTATYRRDSTLVAPYERWQQFSNASIPTKAKRNYAHGKTKGAAMFVSNCGASNNRLEFANDLGTHYPVDIYGACGSKRCVRYDKKCFEMLNSDYKFYLAFENANCRDYITEKFFVNGLGHDAVPIVMGAHPDEYRKSAPPHSYIHVEDFPDAKSLAAYLKKLDQNDDLYNEYFRWKGTGEFLNTKFWCRLCAMVSDDRKPRLVIDDLNQWWRSEGTCRSDRWTRS